MTSPSERQPTAENFVTVKVSPSLYARLQELSINLLHPELFDAEVEKIRVDNGLAVGTPVNIEVTYG